MFLIIFTSIFVLSANACFCPSIFGASCGCNGHTYGGGYPTAPPIYRPWIPYRRTVYYLGGSYAPFIPQYVMRPSYGPLPYLPPMYSLPNPRFIRPSSPAPRIPTTPTISHTAKVPKPIINVEPAAEIIKLHDNENRNYKLASVTTTSTSTTPQITYTIPVTTTISTTTTTTNEPDFVDDGATSPSGKGKEDYYYAYYDENGNKVGDSRTGTTFAQKFVDESTTPIVEVRTVSPENTGESYDDVVEEDKRKLQGTKNQEVEYEEEEEEVATTKEPVSQILVDASGNNVYEIENPYKIRIAAADVKTVQRARNNERKIHSN